MWFLFPASHLLLRVYILSQPNNLFWGLIQPGQDYEIIYQIYFKHLNEKKYDQGKNVNCFFYQGKMKKIIVMCFWSNYFLFNLSNLEFLSLIFFLKEHYKHCVKQSLGRKLNVHTPIVKQTHDIDHTMFQTDD